MSTHMSRRRLVRLLGGAALATIPAIKRADEASAARTWCRYDPLYRIGGRLFDLSVASYTDMLTAATGPVKIVLTVPSGVPVETIYQDDGFGYGYETTVISSRKLKLSKNYLSLGVAVVAPATDGTLPVQIFLTSLDTKTTTSQQVVNGYANLPVVWAGKIESVEPIDWFVERYL